MMNKRRRMRALGLVLGLAGLVGLAGCRSRPTDAGGTSPAIDPAPAKLTPPWIKADPNPVTIPAGAKNGSTTISWDAGENSPDAQVYLHVASGKEDKLLSGGARYSQTVDWIGKSARYEFILYADKDRRKELARVTVAAAK